MKGTDSSDPSAEGALLDEAYSHAVCSRTPASRVRLHVSEANQATATRLERGQRLSLRWCNQDTDGRAVGRAGLAIGTRRVASALKRSALGDTPTATKRVRMGADLASPARILSPAMPKESYARLPHVRRQYPTLPRFDPRPGGNPHWKHRGVSLGLLQFVDHLLEKVARSHLRIGTPKHATFGARTPGEAIWSRN